MAPRVAPLALPLLGLAAALLGAARGAAVVVERGGAVRAPRRQVVRSESRSQRTVMVDPAGLLDVDSAEDAMSTAQPEQAFVKSGIMAGSTDAQHEDCRRLDYKYGIANTNTCDHSAPGRQQIFDDPTMCQQAASDLNMTFPLSWRLGPKWYDVRPKGCFKFPCSESAKGECIFYNPVEKPMPKDPQGIPLCHSPMYANGTANTTEECPTGYTAIKDYTACERAAPCLDYCEGAGTQFDVNMMNRSKFHEFPEGCFTHHSDQHIYFNRPLATMGKPAHPVGTPLCIKTAGLVP